MTEQLEQKLNESLTSLLEWVDTAGEFVSDQAPLVVNEILAWGVTKETTQAVGVSLITLVVLMATSAVWAWKIKKKINPIKQDIPLLLMALVLGLTLSIGLCFTCVDEWLDVVYINVAPRLYILEQLKGLI